MRECQRRSRRLMTRPLDGFVLLALAVSGAPLTAQEPSARVIVERARDRFRAGVEPAEAYTVIQRTLGDQDTIRWTSDGTGGDLGMRQTRRQTGAEPDGRQMVKSMLAVVSMPLLAVRSILSPATGDRMDVVGTEEIDGRSTYVLSISAVPLSFPMLGLAGEVAGRIWIGTEDDLVHRLELGVPVAPDSPDPRRGSIQYTDFREVDGYAYPFRVEIQLPGLGQASPLDRVEASIEEMQRRRAELPEPTEAERAQVGAALARIELMQGALAVVRELRAAPPTVIETLEFSIGR